MEVEEERKLFKKEILSATYQEQERKRDKEMVYTDGRGGSVRLSFVVHVHCTATDRQCRSERERKREHGKYA